MNSVRMELISFDLSVEALIGSLFALFALGAFCRSLLIEDVICIPGKSKHGWKSIKILDRVCVTKSEKSTIYII